MIGHGDMEMIAMKEEVCTNRFIETRRHDLPYRATWGWTIHWSVGRGEQREDYIAQVL